MTQRSRANDFRLLGHTKPVSYPSIVSAVGVIDGKLSIVFQVDRLLKPVIEFVHKSTEFIPNSIVTNRLLRKSGYSILVHELYAIDPINIFSIDKSDPSDFYTAIGRHRSSDEFHVFIRLECARRSNDDSKFILELINTAAVLKVTGTDYAENWYKKELSKLPVHVSDEMPNYYDLGE